MNETLETVSEQLDKVDDLLDTDPDEAAEILGAVIDSLTELRNDLLEQVGSIGGDLHADD